MFHSRREMSDLSVSREPIQGTYGSLEKGGGVRGNRRFPGEGRGRPGEPQVPWIPWKKLKNFFLDGSVQQTNQNESN